MVTWRAEESSGWRRSRETTTLATGGESTEAEAAEDCQALETMGGHFMSHTDLSALEVSTLISPLL